jgi:hypothetical protein
MASLFEAIPTISGTQSRVYTPDIITVFLMTYYNWIIFFIGVFLILYTTRRHFFPKKQDPLDFEERQLTLWERYQEWIRRD